MNAEPDKLNTTPEDPPAPGSATTPVALLVALILLLLWGMSYLDSHGGGFQATVYAPYVSFKRVNEDQVRLGSDASYYKGKEVYDRICTLCHQPTGLGEAGKAPPLAGSEWVLAQNPNRVIRIVLHGLTGPIPVKGQEWNLQMVAWNGVLTLEEIANVLTYVRQNKDWGNNASDVKVEQVKTIMEKEKDRSENWTAERLLKIPETE